MKVHLITTYQAQLYVQARLSFILIAILYFNYLVLHLIFILHLFQEVFIIIIIIILFHYYFMVQVKVIQLLLPFIILLFSFNFIIIIINPLFMLIQFFKHFLLLKAFLLTFQVLLLLLYLYLFLLLLLFLLIHLQIPN